VNIDDSRRSYGTRCEGHRSPGLLMRNILSLRSAREMYLRSRCNSISVDS
jgi:hypothetical protein